MEIEQRFTLATPPQQVWRAFEDVRLLVNCLPGASIHAAPDADVPPHDVPLLFQVKLGPIAAAFKGQGALERDAAAQAGTFSGSAVDGKTQSRVKGVARFALAPDAAAGGTCVTVAVDYTITGALAQFSREGIVRALAEQLTREFAANLQGALAHTQQENAAHAVAEGTKAAAPGAASGASDAASATVAAVAAVAPVAVPSMSAASPPPARTPANPPPAAAIDLWSVFKAWLRHWWASRRKTS